MIFDYLEQQIDCEDLGDRKKDRLLSIRWAREILGLKNKVVYLDTETTGLTAKDEIIELAIVNYQGKVLFNSLIKPTCPITEGAKAIHKITEKDLENAPVFPQVFPQIKSLLEGKTVIIYNKDFDLDKLEYQCKIHDLPPLVVYSSEFDFTPNISFDCAMHWYAQYYGSWHDYYQSYIWQKLKNAGHRASSDAIACYNLVGEMANTYVPKPKEKYPLFPSPQIFIEWQKWTLYLRKERDYYVDKRLVSLFFPQLRIKKNEGNFPLTLKKEEEQEVEEKSHLERKRELDEIPF